MGTAWVVGGSLVAAILAYVFQVLGGRLLGAEAFAPISVLWTVQFLAMQVLYQPLEHLVNREVRHGRTPGLVRITTFGVVAGVAAAGVLWATRELYVDEGAYMVIAAALIVGYALFGYVRGQLAGEERFQAFGLMTASEAAVRVVAALLLVWGFGALGLAWAMLAAPLVAFVWLRPRPERYTDTGGVFGQDLKPLLAAAAFAQALLGLPPLVAAAFGATAATVSMVFMTFTVYRGPIWVLQGIMARLLPVFVDHARAGEHEQLRRWMTRILAGTVGLAVVAGAAGATIAPPVLAWLAGPDFRPGALFSALVAAGVGLAAGGGFMNQVLLATGRLRVITLSWAVGFAVAGLVAVLVPGDAVLRVGAGFLAGEIVAVALLTTLYLRGIHDVRVEERYLDPGEVRDPDVVG